MILLIEMDLVEVSLSRSILKPVSITPNAVTALRQRTRNAVSFDIQNSQRGARDFIPAAYFL
jgi:hypothetical protein